MHLTPKLVWILKKKEELTPIAGGGEPTAVQIVVKGAATWIAHPLQEIIGRWQMSKHRCVSQRHVFRAFEIDWKQPECSTVGVYKEIIHSPSCGELHMRGVGIFFFK